MFDLAYLEENFGSDQELLKEVFSAYSHTARGALAEFQLALEAEDLSAFAQACHKLKSSSRVVGDKILSDLCDELEVLACEQRLSDVVRDFPLLKDRIDLSISEANKYLL